MRALKIYLQHLSFLNLNFEPVYAFDKQAHLEFFFQSFTFTNHASRFTHPVHFCCFKASCDPDAVPGQFYDMFLAVCFIHSVLTDFGLVMGVPNARFKTS